MKIAKIVSSNSHIDYVGRVIDELDAADPPGPDEYGFGKFVSIPLDKSLESIGVIYNSMLMNPDYANYGPRLSSANELEGFSPDFLNEQGCLIGILLLGSMEGSGKITQNIPTRIIPAGKEIFAAAPEDVRHFHRDENGRLQIHYYSQIIGHAGNFGVPLLESIIEGLGENGCSDEDKKRLGVLKQSLAWQRTIGGMRL
ncbi:MAG: hypothetical protein HKN25_02440 [Pyrinomonadaceae bacterium]|nr:hypothetical protein [Pyrinomonadaceae bacterium]